MKLAATSSQLQVTYHVSGFTCITCAVGLDTVLERRKGVVSCNSSYKDARTTVCFHPEIVSEAEIRNAIAEMGFTAATLA